MVPLRVSTGAASRRSSRIPPLDDIDKYGRATSRVKPRSSNGSSAAMPGRSRGTIVARPSFGVA
jgi:hypothetical protein